ncbi:DUF4271 domain-containing protein [Rapidithrix thailandica]|uniref:DUF4271 domain-containing protein n=1 Tax=Rapidithrix thailandica TaxID=413964 RepID=A0AAW9RV09_9BACT
MRLFKINRFFFLVLFVCFNSALSAQVRSLADQWLVYDPELKTLVPYVEELHQRQQGVHLLVPLDKYKKGVMDITFQESGSLFINNQLLRRVSNEELSYDLDSLRKAFGNKEVFVTYYANRTVDGLPDVKIRKKVKKANSTVKVSSKTDTSEVAWAKLKFAPGYKNDLILLGMLMMVCYAVFTKYSSILYPLNSLGRTFRNFYKVDSVIHKVNGTDVLIFILYSGLLSAYIVIIFLYNFTPEQKFVESEYNRIMEFNLWLRFLLIVVVVVGIVVCKLIIVWFLAQFHSYRHLANLHLQEFIRFTQFFGSLFLLGTFLVVLQIETLDWEMLSYVLISVLVLNSLCTCYRIYRHISFRKVYLFSYFCATEFLPILFIIKFLMRF